MIIFTIGFKQEVERLRNEAMNEKKARLEVERRLAEMDERMNGMMVLGRGIEQEKEQLAQKLANTEQQWANRERQLGEFLKKNGPSQDAPEAVGDTDEDMEDPDAIGRALNQMEEDRKKRVRHS